MKDGVKQADVAGMFYPGDAKALEAAAAKFLAGGKGPAPALRALVVPHAGYDYSGAVAGQGYALVDPDAFDTVVVMAPSHRFGFACADVGEFAEMATPLGTIPVATEICEALKQATPLVQGRREVFHQEHALEVQLPFLQVLFARKGRTFRLVPLLVGQLERESVAALAAALKQCLPKERTLVVVSSDFTHYGRNFDYQPFHGNVLEQIRKLDQGAASLALQLRTDDFLDYIDRTGATICGRWPIAILCSYLQGCGPLACRFVAYANSADATGDTRHCVSYAALAFETTTLPAGAAAPAGAEAQEPETAEPGTLSLADKRALLSLVRQTIGNVLLGKRSVPTPSPLSPALAAPGCCFVTLHLHGDLRGCMGTLGVGKDPLWKNVVENAQMAAFRDPRFSPLSQSEFVAVKLEISVLTPPRPIASWREIELGQHGIYLIHGRRRAVFLPQVAPEQGWDLDTTLEHLAMKAGLAPDAWQEESCRFEVFEAIVFSDDEVAKGGR